MYEVRAWQTGGIGEDIFEKHPDIEIAHQREKELRGDGYFAWVADLSTPTMENVSSWRLPAATIE